MRGFIDLVFEHEGKFFVVDFKSNHLGSYASDYAPALLTAPMVDHHYYLQYHLYVTALHRHLTARRSGYDYDRDFGGVHYLFLRGMAPHHPAGTGVFFDRPSRVFIEALSELFEGTHSDDAKPELGATLGGPAVTLSLATLSEAGVFSELDCQFSAGMARLAGETNSDVLVGLALTSRQTRAGHVCVDLAAFAEARVTTETGEPPSRRSDGPRSIAGSRV